MTTMNTPLFPAEWYPQSAIMMTFPHQNTDWQTTYDQALPCFVAIAKEISRFEPLIINAQNIDEIKSLFVQKESRKITFCEMPIDDTWARDHAGITVLKEGKATILDFGFNGWGEKFNAENDNKITRNQFSQQLFPNGVAYQDCLDFILEGGSVETDGKGTLLTTSHCLTAPHRNNLSHSELEKKLKYFLGINRVLWLNYGYLSGDDTDSHIDTLARFCDAHTIAYVQCTDPADAHYSALKKMEIQLKQFTDYKGNEYKLVPLPMAEKITDSEMRRLPATYANFLILNGAVLVPSYRSRLDVEAKKILQGVFADREVISVDCLPLIQQNGSLHCITMQLPKEVMG